jgi:F0F1-type ATP synthase membrane subunit c/vacuolar-type H+-ATPase subunit K
MLLFTSNEILSVAIAASFAAGLNVYATVATLGLLSHVHAFQLPPALHMLGSWPVILVSLALFGLELFADKVPVFDLLWNALNTFVKVPVATLLSYGAAQHLSPGLQVAVAALGGAIALAAHGSKIAIRTAVTPSPEPFSNIALSLAEDLAAISLTWFATRHPITAGIIVAICLLLAVLAIRYLVRAFRRLFHQTRTFLQPKSSSLT